MNSFVLLSGIFLWFVAGSFLSWTARKKLGKGMVEYFLANRSVGGLLSALTYSATTYSAFMMVGLVGLAYKTGVASLGFELTYLVGTVFLLALFAPRYWAAGKRFNLLTPSEMLSFRYESPAVGMAAALLCIIMLVPYAAVQLMGMGYLLETLSGGAISFRTATIIGAAMSFIFSWWAGLRSVALTDALQSAIMFVASIALAGFVGFVLLPEGPFPFPQTNPKLLEVSWSLPMFIGLTLPWFFFAVTNPQVVQRLYSPRSIGSIRKMILGFSFFGFVYTVLCVYLGFSAASLAPGLEAADNAMASLLSLVPPALALVVTLSIMAAAVSTMNSIILTLSSMFGRDILKGALPNLDENREMVLSKAFIPIITIACLAFAQYRFDLIAVLSSMASGGLLMQLPAVIGAFFWKKSTAPGAFWSITAGGVLTGMLYVTGAKPFGQWPPVWGLLLASIVFVTVSLLTAPPQGTGRFLDSVKDDLAHILPGKRPG
ncbi:MAG: sodium:solute symporter family protein [Thermovirgaceae bacterium]